MESLNLRSKLSRMLSALENNSLSESLSSPIFIYSFIDFLTITVYIALFQSYTGYDKHFFKRKIVNIFLPISFRICFGCSKELSH